MQPFHHKVSYKIANLFTSMNVYISNLSALAKGSDRGG